MTFLRSRSGTIFYYFSYLLETNILGVFMEALTADVQTVLSDDSMSVGAGTARKKMKFFLLIFFEVMENVLAIFTAFHLIFLPYSILHLPMAWSWSIISWMSVPNASETHDYLIFCDFSSSQIEVSAKKKVFIPHMRSRPWQSLWSVDFFQIFRQRFFHMWFF